MEIFIGRTQYEHKGSNIITCSHLRYQDDLSGGHNWGRKLNHGSVTSKLLDFVAHDCQNVSSRVIIADQIHKFGLSEKVQAGDIISPVSYAL